MAPIVVSGTPTLLAAVRAPKQIYIQNQSSSVASVLPENGTGGTQIQTGDTLIMGFQDPLVPEIRVFGVGSGVLDVEVWPY